MNLRLRFLRIARSDGGWIGSFVSGFSALAVPAAIALACALVLALGDRQFAHSDAEPVEFHVARLNDNNADFAQADAALARTNSAPVLSWETKLLQAPFALLIESADEAGKLLEFPSRHTRSMSCWTRSTGGLIGTADRNGTSGAFRASRAGFVLLPATPPGESIVCSARFEGPARISIDRWTPQGLEQAEREFHRSSGLVDGGLITLAVFVFVVAVINREWAYVVFSGWLIANLRMAAISAGWDSTWLEHTIPDNYILTVRALTTAAYYVLTGALFLMLFRAELARVRHPELVQAIRYSTLVVLVASLALPFHRYLPVLWLLSTLSVGAIVFLLCRILYVTRSRAAAWYAASLAFTLLAALSEVVAAAMGYRRPLTLMNSVTGALISSLLAAIAIAERLRLERRAKIQARAESIAHLRRFRQTYRDLPVGLFTVDEAGHLTEFNPAFQEIFPCCPHSPPALWSAVLDTAVLERLRLALESNANVEIEIEHESSGECANLLVRASRRGELVQGAVQDITQRKRAEHALRRLTEHDALTGLLNRKGLELPLEQALQQARAGRVAAVACVNLSRFRLLNEMYGRQAADEVLKQVAQRLRAELPATARAGRIAGDEFMIVFAGQTFSAYEATIARMLASIGQSRYETGDKSVQVSAHAGVVELTGAMSAKDALVACDQAARGARLPGRQGLVVHRSNDTSVIDGLEAVRYAQRLREALPTDHLALHAQPIVSLANPFGSLNFEVLLRVRDDSGLLVAPGSFIAAAERAGQMSSIDRWVLANTLEWLSVHDGKLPRTQFVCMNLSGASLNDDHFVRDAFALLSEHRQVASRLCFEITEQVALYDLASTREFVSRLRMYDVTVALDDFGSGYTSFKYLREIPAAALKIDGDFVRAARLQAANYGIIRTITDLAHHYGMKCVAEWAEEAEVVEALVNLGVDYAQGFALGKPMELARLLAARSAGDLIPDAAVRNLFQHVKPHVQPVESIQRVLL